jgi:hypothetical protein
VTVISAHVPRNLRVRPSIQLGSTRVPARAFLIVAGLIFVGGLLVVAGADLITTAKMTGGLSIASLIVFELRCWGRSTREVTHILWRHCRRPRQIRQGPVMIVMPVEVSTKPTTRRPRWQQ